MKGKNKTELPGSQSPVEILSEFVLPARMERLKQVAASRTTDLTIVLDRIYHPHNLSAVIRSAEAFGIQNIYYVGERLEFSSGVTMGSERWVNILKYSTPADALNALRLEQFELVALEPNDECRKNSIPVFQLPFNRKLALVFGSEKGGLCEDFREVASIKAHIPMFGFVESFNISVAAAICLFCSSISGASAARQVGTISEKFQEELLAKWLREDVKGSDGILKRMNLIDGNS